MTLIRKKAFITGGNGKIGRHLVNYLLRKGFDIIILTRKSNTPWQNNNKVRVIKGDLLDKATLVREIPENSYVFHLAAYQDINDPNRENFFKSNVLGTEILLESCLSKKIRKVIYVSTIIVYEDTRNNQRDEKWNLRDIKTSDHYAATKLEGLAKVRSFQSNKKDAFPLVTVFPSMVIDVNDFHSSTPTTASFLQRFLWEKIGGGVPGGIINLIGRGERILNYVVMDDLVEGLLLAANHGRNGEEYILGGENITARNYLKILTNKRRKKVFPFRIPIFPFKIVFLFKRILKLPPVIGIIAQNISRNYFFSSEKAKNELGYNPKCSL